MLGANEKTHISSNKQLRRQSNVELLRLICMFMIVMHHFTINVWFPNMLNLHVPSSVGETILLLSHCLFFIGVNCFVLISGYFSIKTSLRSFFHLYGFYAFLIALSQYFGDAQFAMMPLHEKWFHIIVHSLMPWDNNDFWFLNAYLALFMMAPLLNVAIHNMKKTTHIRVLVLLTILDVVFGGFLNIELLNTWGFCVAQFVYLYVIGGYIRKYVPLETLKIYRWHTMWIYIISAALWGICVAVQVYVFPFFGRFFKAFAYNNIFVLIGAIAFFIFILSFDIKSKVINWLSTSCLAAYLLQGSILPYCWYSGILDRYPPLKNPCQIMLVSILFLLVALLFDKLRVFMVQPIEKISCKYFLKIEERINNLYDKNK